MATVFMKWLETRPETYDRGIQFLTLGQLGKFHENLVASYIHEGTRVLEIGCGTGSLTVRMAAAGARVVAIDNAANMLAAAESRIREAGLGEFVELQLLDAGSVDDEWEPAGFDLVVASLSLSEMDDELRHQVLQTARRLVKSSSHLLVIDEAVPESFPGSLLYSIVSVPLRSLVWVLTRTTTHPLKQFEDDLADTGWDGHVEDRGLGGSLRIWKAMPLPDIEEASRSVRVAGQLTGGSKLHSFLMDAWELFFRIIPPYPKIQPGLYKLGDPGLTSPVLVTGNFDLTVRRLFQVLDGRVDAWVQVVDSGGINVWCAAGGGFLTAEKIISALKVSRVEAAVETRRVILPQLCASGVAGWKIREAGWEVRWGPVRAHDLPAYLQSEDEKTVEMREVSFPLKDRLEMATVTLGFYGLLILIPIALFWPGLLLPAALAFFGVSYFYALTLTRIPGKDGLQKSIPLALISVAGLAIYTVIWDPVTIQDFFNRTMGIVAISVFVAAEMQGMSPEMRGEQANWIWEGVIGVFLLGVFFLIPLLVGWS